jgi:hypothetical protein
VRSTGAGESGKSTVLKQMKLIYSQGFSKNEKLEWKPVIFNNIVQSFKVIAEAMGEHDLHFDSPDNEVSQVSLNSTVIAGMLPLLTANHNGSVAQDIPSD